VEGAPGNIPSHLRSPQKKIWDKLGEADRPDCAAKQLRRKKENTDMMAAVKLIGHQSVNITRCNTLIGRLQRYTRP